MSDLERWDIILRFLDGPLAYRGELPMLGPTIHVGSNPGPDGLKMEGYRGIDDRQAVFTAYDGATVSIAPIGTLQVRVSPDEHVNWNNVSPLRQHVYLSPGDAIHFGPPNRGGTCIFIRAQRMGEWQQGKIMSEAAQGSSTKQKGLASVNMYGDSFSKGSGSLSGKGAVSNNQSASSRVKVIDTMKGIPIWFIPMMLGTGSFFTLSLGLIVFIYFQQLPDPIGPIQDGYEYVDITQDLDKLIAQQTDKSIQIASSRYGNIEAAYDIFVASPNADAAKQPALKEQKNFDKKLFEWVKRSAIVLGGYKKFWDRLDAVKESYAHVLHQTRKAGLPDVIAGIPYQESGYTAQERHNLVCARGWWQFLPEIAKQAEIPISSCMIAGRSTPWEPTMAPPIGILSNAVYVNHNNGTKYGCLIQSCATDGRTDLVYSTQGAMKLLKKAYDDERLKASGSITQLVIASHNAGYDNSPYDAKKQRNRVNIRWAFEDFVKKYNKEQVWAPDFFGRNITCETASAEGGYAGNTRCGESVMVKETQHYVPLIIAQHILAACYYGTNYPDFEVEGEKVFRAYADNLVQGNGYCTTIKVPRPGIK
jgi:hypothetical protein